jgi:transcriptional pleiotropic regulator of transition state genes
MIIKITIRSLRIYGKDGILLMHFLSKLKTGGRIIVKSIGVVRKVDELGRVVIPIELRRNLGIAENDSMEIYVESEKIILQKYEPSCTFCGSTLDVLVFRNKNVCKECAENLINDFD